jgi:GNAT superfamily N-acetyltransferase
MALKIRKAEANDCGLILDFIKGLAEYEKLVHEVVATPELLRQNLFGSQPKAEVLIAEWNNQPAGFALFFHNFSTFLGRPGIYLEDLFVLPELRAHGIGKGLLKRLAQLAVERGCGRLEWSVLDWNKPAIDFYLSLGAASMDEWTVHRLTGDKLLDFAKS